MNINTILSISVILSLVLSCGNSKENEKEINPETISVQVSKANGIQNVGNNAFVVSGKLESSNTSNVSAKVMGKILQIPVREGQYVKAGQLIAVIKSDDLRAQKSQTSAVISEAQAALQNAQTNFNRFQTLYNQQSATKFELDNAKMQLDMAKSRVAQAKQAQNQVSSIIAEANVTAPFSGTVTQKHTEAGALASPGMPLVTIEATGNLVLKALIPESEIENVKTGQVVEVTFQANGDKTSGQISLINPSTQFTGSQYEIEIRLIGNKQIIQHLKSGMYANVLINRIYERKPNANDIQQLYIPKTAIVENGQLKGIYTVSKDNKAILRWIRIGKDLGDKVEVLSGLSANESFITNADSKLYNGASVAVK